MIISTFRLLFVFLWMVCLLPVSAGAESRADLPIPELAQLFTWKKLIQSGKSANGGPLATVLSDGFYLSNTAKLSPKAELQATVRAFASNALIDGSPAACRYPARLLWLSKKLPVQSKGWSRPACPELDKWANLDELDGISLIQVSGYFGNPASAFGHLLLQVNRKGETGLRGLQDIGVNFGASIPDGEGTLAYVFKGLFGAYNAGFSDQSFYAQDYVYSATEFRDMWAYDLHLSDYQKSLILYHLWELKDALFKYYFLKINCAFHLAQLMEIALETDFGLDHQPWYLPVSVFHKLNDIEAENPGSLIKSIQFIPSLQREVHLGFDTLTDKDKRLVNRYASGSQMELPPMASSSLLEFLLLYVDYKIQSSAELERTAWRERRRSILLARLQQPISSGAAPAPRMQGNRFAPPAAGPRTKKIGAGIQVNEDGVLGQSLVFAPFAYDILHNNTASLVDSNFKLGETGVSHNDGVTRLDRFEIISIEKLSPPVTTLAGEQVWTWRMAMGAKHFSRRCARCLSPMIEGGIGRSKAFGALNLYGYATAEANRLGVDVGLAIGALWQMMPRLKWRLESQVQALSDQDSLAAESLVTHTISALFNLGNRFDLSFEAETVRSDATALALLNYRW